MEKFAGVRPDEPVMLVGHSEGGIVAVNAACHAAASRDFDITHVDTAGAPIGDVARRLPATVRVLALEHDADLVPHLDGATNPDRPNITTVHMTEHLGGITDDHDLTESYEPEASAAACRLRNLGPTRRCRNRTPTQTERNPNEYGTIRYASRFRTGGGCSVRGGREGDRH